MGSKVFGTGVHRLAFPVPAPISFDPSKRKNENLISLIHFGVYDRWITIIHSGSDSLYQIKKGD